MSVNVRWDTVKDLPLTDGRPPDFKLCAAFFFFKVTISFCVTSDSRFHLTSVIFRVVEFGETNLIITAGRRDPSQVGAERAAGTRVNATSSASKRPDTIRNDGT